MLFEQQNIAFPTSFDKIKERIDGINPQKYGYNRNFIDGDVTYLSPYISRGVISTKQVYHSVLDKGYQPKSIEKFIQELAWRDYWQQIWINKGTAIDKDLKQIQPDVENYKIPEAIINANTGIKAIDESIEAFYSCGYIHNHLRMYIASLACNVSKSHWKLPAQWMYYHLLDADWASNALSWQWVCGSNSNKKYYANQENVNKYCYTKQSHTFLDRSYQDLASMAIPKALNILVEPELKTVLPPSEKVNINECLPSYVYNFYNLDPTWARDIKANRILLLEPSHFNSYPVSQYTIDFVIELSQHITGIQIFVGEFHELKKLCNNSNIHFKEHPLNSHYTGKEECRDWMFEAKGYYKSFFAFWKQCKKEIVW